MTALNQSITASDEGDGTSEQLSGLIETNADIQPGDSGGAAGRHLGRRASGSTPRPRPASRSSPTTSPRGTRATPSRSTPRSPWPGRSKPGTAPPPSTSVRRPSWASRSTPSGNSSGNGGNGGGGNDGGGFGGFFGGNSGSTGNTGSTASGAPVASVVTNGPAQEAGLAEGDVITSLGGKTIRRPTTSPPPSATYHPGDKVSIGWTDGSGQTHTATVQLSSGPPQ